MEPAPTPLDGTNTLQEVLDFLPYPFLVALKRNAVWTNAFVNKKFEQEIGYSLAEMPTIEEWFQLAYPDPVYRKNVKDDWAIRMKSAAEQGSDSVFTQVMIHTRDCGDRWYEVKSRVMGTLQLVAFIDIHIIKLQKENLKKLNENRDRILSILSHDLRGPVNNLYTLSKFFGNEHINKDDFKKMILELNAKAFQTMDFLTTTLEWAKSNFNIIQVKKEVIDLKLLIEGVVDLYETQYRNKNITVRQRILTSSSILIDREIVTSVLRNIFSNAIKFTRENGWIEIATHQTNEALAIEIRDNGIGIPEEKIKAIEGSHYQSEPGTHGEKGLGIGMLICKNLLNKINGQLKISSPPGEGTTITVVLQIENDLAINPNQSS